jgi:two-component system, OmpR family, sensor histidine kinase MprB
VTAVDPTLRPDVLDALDAPDASATDPPQSPLPDQDQDQDHDQAAPPRSNGHKPRSPRRSGFRFRRLRSFARLRPRRPLSRSERQSDQRDQPEPEQAVRRRRTGSRASARADRRRSVSLRTRITLTATLAVALGIGAGVSFAYLAVQANLRNNIDQQLTRQAATMQGFAIAGGAHKLLEPYAPGTKPPHGTFFVNSPRRRFGDSLTYTQVIDTSGAVSLPRFQTAKLPVDAQDEAIAAGAKEQFSTIDYDGAPTRLLTAPVGHGYAIQVALPLTSVDSQLDQLGLELLAAGLAGILGAAALGWWVTRTSLRPVGQLTATVERITATRDLAHRIDAGGRDELGRLAVSFNAMLETVQDATDRQRQLVADASHELRTPLTSLRTNIEVLRKIELLDPEDRDRLISSVLVGIDDLTALVADTVELARGEEPAAAVEPFRWDELAERVVARARTHWPEAEFAVDRLEPCELAGVPDRVQRAMANLLDNAAKFAGGRGRVDIALRRGEKPGTAVLTVRDHGPGIDDQDLPHVFDRFYRSASTRDRPGSGLGLAIVAQVAESHHGTVAVANHPDGGAVLTLTLPTEPIQV